MAWAADQITTRDGSLVQTYKDSATNRHVQGVLLYGPNGSVAAYDTTLDALRTVQVNQQQILYHELWHQSDRAGNPITMSSTGLNSLAGSAGYLETATISNDTELDMKVDLELVIPTLAGAPANGDTIGSLYWIRQIDGTNFETASSTGPVLPSATPDAVFKARGTGTAQRMIVAGVTVPVRSFRYLLVNNDTTAWTASGNTLKGFFYGTQGYHPGA